MISAIRPKLELLSQEFIEKIVDESYILLERQGIFVENTQAIELFKEAGMKVDESTHRVFITRQAAVTILDHKTQEQRKAETKDVVDQAVQEDLHSIMLSDAKNYGLSALPEKGLP